MADLSALSDTELTRMADRAYREAARSWQEARQSGDGSIRPMLFAAAEAADAYWRDLRDEQESRLAELSGPTEDTSTSLTYVVQPSVTPVMSPMAARFAASPHTARPKADQRLGDGIAADRRTHK